MLDRLYEYRLFLCDRMLEVACARLRSALVFVKGSHFDEATARSSFESGVVFGSEDFLLGWRSHLICQSFLAKGLTTEHHRLNHDRLPALGWRLNLIIHHVVPTLVHQQQCWLRLAPPPALLHSKCCRLPRRLALSLSHHWRLLQLPTTLVLVKLSIDLLQFFQSFPRCGRL